MPPTAGAGAAIGAGNHGVSDPGTRACNGPTPVRTGRSRHGRLCRFRLSETIWLAARSAACLMHRTRSIVPRSSGRFGPVHPENVARKQVAFMRACQSVAVLEIGGFERYFRCRLAPSRGDHTWNHLDASAITTTMLHLCSAPCKALRFAPTARARGLRALTVPARR